MRRSYACNDSENGPVKHTGPAVRSRIKAVIRLSLVPAEAARCSAEEKVFDEWAALKMLMNRAK